MGGKGNKWSREKERGEILGRGDEKIGRKKEDWREKVRSTSLASAKI